VFLAQLITSILATGAMIFLIRYLGPNDFGIYSYVVTIMGLMGIFADCGIGLYLVGRISSNKMTVNKFFSAHFFLQIFISILFLAALFIFAIFQQQIIVRNLILITSIGLFFSNLHIPFATVLKGMEDMKYLVFLSILSGFTTILIIALGIFFKFNLIYFSLLAVMPGIFSFLISFYFAKKYISLQKFESQQIKNIFFQGVPYGLMVAVGFLYNRIDIIMLKNMTSDNDVGFYSAAYKLIFAFNMIPTALSAALYPMLSNYSSNASHKIEFILVKLSKYLFILTIIVAFYVYNYSYQIVNLLFGHSFILSSIALQLLIISFIPNCARIPVSNYFLAERHIKKLSLVFLAGAILNVTLNYFLIHSFSFYGAAAATVFCECVMVIIYYAMIGREFPKFILKTSLFHIFFITFLILALIYFTNYSFITPFFVVFFIIGLFLFKVVTKEEIAIFFSTFQYFLRKIKKNG
jgi:O-antigen/teichoic acid export membrane protein